MLQVKIWPVLCRLWLIVSLVQVENNPRRVWCTALAVLGPSRSGVQVHGREMKKGFLVFIRRDFN